MMTNNKTIYFYVLAIVSVVIMCLLSPCTVIGDHNETYSVLKTISLFSKEQMMQNGIILRMAANGIGTYWTYLVMSVTLSMPMALHVFHELKSKMYMNVMTRKGRYRYIYQRCFNAVGSGVIIILTAMFIYSIIVLCCFPMKADNIIMLPEDVYTLSKFVKDIASETGHFLLYGIMLSVIGTFFVYLYLDLLFDMSLAFIFAYFTMDMFLNENYIFPVVVITTIIITYGIMWRIRSTVL